MKIAFFKGRHPGWKGWLGILTRWWTVGPYSHCELVFGEPDEEGLSTCWSSTWLDKGVRCAQVKLDPADWDIIDLSHLGPKAEANALAWFESHKGAPYDVLALFGFLFRPIKGMGNMYFCDEACLEALSIPEAWRQDPNSAATIVLGMSSLLAPDVQAVAA
jgi:hypothetical protein